MGDFNPGVGDDHDVFDESDTLPTTSQYYATAVLVQWLDQEYGIEEVVGHRDVNKTVCPGDNAMPFVKLLDKLLK